MEALKKAFGGFANAFKVEALRKKILFTLGILIVYRIGSHITIPGVDATVLAEYFRNNNNMFGLYDSFTGGAFARLRCLPWALCRISARALSSS